MAIDGRVLALDPGSQKIGLALSDPTKTLSQPYNIWSFDDNFWGKLSELISTQKIITIVIGIPIGFRGETKQTQWTNDFAKQVENQVSIPVIKQSEIFTSKIAQQNRQNLAKKHRQKADDAEAAAVLLQDFLDNKTNNQIQNLTYAS